MNPWVILGGVLVWVASIAGSYAYGTDVGKTGEIARVAELKQAMEETREQAKLGAADAIAKNKVKHTVIQGKVQTIIKDVPVYRDCEHTDDAFRLLNDAITGKSGTGRDSDSSLPRNVSPVR